MSNSLDPDQAWHVVGPDLGPNCLKRLSVDDKSCLSSSERAKSSSHGRSRTMMGEITGNTQDINMTFNKIAIKRLFTLNEKCSF